MAQVHAFVACIVMLVAGTGARAGERQVSEFRYDHAPAAAILVCPGTTASADCDAHSAVESLISSASPGRIGCGVQSQELLAGSGVAMREDQYVKVACPRETAQSD
ncbi:MAG TPA: hypothetical protein VGG79_17525 [Roseiarcus sp.]